ncbi:BTAD domain-containing putative transcriptional regulator [Nonomuraea typhae]|uniref:BTAD domain-containing putative transcriptional regulator n=1 Tax=Nonomuraea typhae TaxID=2603600 RepID=A0ABW7YMH7_9ACTN
MRIHLLGPVGGVTAAGTFDAGPPRQQAVLAMLAMSAPHVVTMTALVDGLWGDGAPRSAGQSIYTYVAGLRRVLEPVSVPRRQPTVLVGGAGGYRLEVEPAQVDVYAFALHAERARSLRERGDHAAALTPLDQALELVRATPLSGVPGPFAEAERGRLREMWLDIREHRADVLVRLGRVEEATAALRRLLAHHRLRERARELLMLALHRAGRQAEALEVFAEGRRVLAEELGVDPGPGLRRAHALILRADAAESPARAPAEPTAWTSAEAPARTPAEPPSRSPVEPPARSPVESPARSPAEPPAGTAAEPPARTPAEPPAGARTRTAAEVSAEVPARTAAGTPAAALTRTAAEALARTPADVPARTPAEVPRQLPRALLGFVGRVEEQARLTALLAGPAHPMVAISGPPGVGKSALALRVAHAVEEHYPDGQLFVRLHGRTPGVTPLTPLEILGRFLRALGVPGNAVPLDVDEAAATWRSKAAGRRLLVLLDDAAGLEHVRPLLTGPLGVAVIVTSRESLAAGDDCVQIRLGALPAADALSMLSALAGDSRVRADREAAERLSALCDGLPLALRIVGARLADHPDWTLAGLAGRLGDEQRLHELQIGDLAVRAVLASSWTALRDSPNARDRTAARLLALLGALHVPEVTVQLAAVLLGEDVAESEAAAALARLADANLVEDGYVGRYQVHDLIRLYAAELRPEGACAAVVRALEFSVATTRLASTLMDPHRVLAAAPPLTAVPAALETRDQAVAWFLAEEANLVSAAKEAMSRPEEEIARLGVAITFSLLWFHFAHFRPIAMLECNELALAVARRLDDPAMEFHACIHLSGAAQSTNMMAQAISHMEKALELARQLGDGFGEQRALGNLANLHVISERYEIALSYADAQLMVARDLGADVGVRYALLIRGHALTETGRPEEARQSLTEVLAASRKVGDAYYTANAQMFLAEVHLAGLQAARAVARFRRAVALFAVTGYPTGEVRCQVGLSRAFRALGRFDEAAEHSRQALALAAQLDNSRWTSRAHAERDALARDRADAQGARSAR